MPTHLKMFFVQVRLGTEALRTPKFDPNGIRTHDLQIVTVHFMSPRRPLSYAERPDYLPDSMVIILGGIDYLGGGDREMPALTTRPSVTFKLIANLMYYLTIQFGRQYHAQH